MPYKMGGNPKVVGANTRRRADRWLEISAPIAHHSDVVRQMSNCKLSMKRSDDEEGSEGRVSTFIFPKGTHRSKKSVTLHTHGWLPSSA